MALDDDTRAFLAKAAENPPPHPSTVPIADFRAAIRAFRPLGWDEEEIAEVRDVRVPVPGYADVRVRVFRPQTEHPPPLVVTVHGGSWVRLSVEDLEEYYRVLANRSGCALAAVDYTLSPESQFPQAIEEVHASARWLTEHAGELGCEPGRIGLMGDSSGANVAAAATLVARERGDVTYAQQALLIPCLDVRFDSPTWDEFGTGHLLSADTLRWSISKYAPDAAPTNPLLSPLCADDLSGLPPALIVTAEHDPLRDDGERYAARLEEAGVPVTLRCIPGTIHHTLMLPKVIPSAERAMDELAALVRAAFAAVRT